MNSKIVTNKETQISDTNDSVPLSLNANLLGKFNITRLCFD